MSPRWLWVFLVVLASCSRAPKDCPESDSGRPVDAILLAFLSRARAAHHVADAAEAGDDPARAIRALEAIASGPLPGSTQEKLPEVREVLADTLARLADLRSRAQDFDAADRDIDRGLALVPTPTYFRGHLYEIRGLLEERRSKLLKARGAEAEAEAARKRALDALETALKIQAEVIEKSLRKPP